MKSINLNTNNELLYYELCNELYYELYYELCNELYNELDNELCYELWNSTYKIYIA